MRLKTAEFKILQYLRASSILMEGPGTVHLMLSGGRDSVALLELFHNLQRLPTSWSGLDFEIVIHHFNHKQRGLESDEDEAMCIDLAKSLGHPIKVHRWGEEQEKLVQSGENFQALARNWRYDSVRQQAQEMQRRFGRESSWLITTAHHRRDQAETMLLNMARGCGVAGLLGTATWNHKTRILRPFLELPVDLLDEYIETKSLAHREDSSNGKTDYSRNRVRHNVVAELEKINSKVVEHLWTLTGDLNNLHQKSKCEVHPESTSFTTQPIHDAVVETKAIVDVPDLHAFLTSRPANGPLELTREKLANIMMHVRKLTANPKLQDTYIFALSDRQTLTVSSKHLEIKVTSR